MTQELMHSAKAALHAIAATGVPRPRVNGAIVNPVA